MFNSRYNQAYFFSSRNSLMGIVSAILFFIALYFVAKGVFWVLSWLAPILLIATLIIDHKVIVNYGKWILSLFRQMPLTGILVSIFTALGLPVVIFFLFGKAMMNRKVKGIQEQINRDYNYGGSSQEEYIDFEEVKRKPDVLDLPRRSTERTMPQEKDFVPPSFEDENTKKKNRYDNFF